ADRAAAALEELVAEQSAVPESTEPLQPETPSAEDFAAPVVGEDEVAVQDEVEIDADETAEARGAGPAVPSLSPLFQAPEPTPTRRRRSAVRDAGPVTPSTEPAATT